MITAKPNVKLKPWEVLFNHVIGSTKYGDFLDHHNIALMIGEIYPGESYSRQVARANLELSKYGKVLRNLRSQGYEVLMPDDYNKHVGTLIARAFIKMDKARVVSENAPVHLMGATEQQNHKAVTSSVSSISARLLRNVNQARAINKQGPVNPIP